VLPKLRCTVAGTHGLRCDTWSRWTQVSTGFSPEHSAD
jgi:hypothetical protein